jgi:rhodanese-related sulfurtransferase
MSGAGQGFRLNGKIVAAIALLAAGAGLLLVGVPGTQAKIERMRPQLEKTLKSRQRHIDPAELLSLMYNNQLHLFLIDVRDEADFNLFHLEDAYHKPVEKMNAECCRKLKAGGIKVVMSNDEAAADRAYEHLAANGVPNVYILAGGINLWLDIFRDGKPGPPHDRIDGRGDDRLRHRFDRALGHLHPASLPDKDAASGRKYPEKVKVSGPKRKPSGGCGG